MEKDFWGKSTDGEDIYTYTIHNSSKMSAKITNYGAIVLSLFVPDENGKLDDIVLGFEHLEDYFINPPYFGCCVVPCGNRIGGASFSINDKKYEIEANDGVNNLHSGSNALYKRIWEVCEISDNAITLAYHKKDMDMGFPGNMDIHVTYTLTEDNELKITYTGLSDQDTIFNPTNHSYFNLAGHNSGSILDQLVWVNASHFTMTDAASIPNGTLVDVTNTPMDFRVPKAMGPEVDDSYEQLAWAKGYDHNYALDNTEGTIALAASLFDPKSKRYMEVYTDLPGMQLYCGNYIASGSVGKGGFLYEPRAGVCFETQYFPNAINIPSFSQPIAKANEEVETTTIYKFSIKR